MKKIFLLIVLLFCLAGCNDFGDIKGVIINKEYTPAHVAPMAYQIGKVFYYNMLPVPDDYRFKIEKAESGEKKQKWVSINKEIYEQYEVGDYFESLGDDK